MVEHATFERFQTTRWTVIGALSGGSESDRQRAINMLVERYWPPVYAHLRIRGKSADEASDLTQEFFTQVVLGRNLLDKADQSQGKLRSFLLASLKRFLIDQHRRGVARGSKITIPLNSIREEEDRYANTASGNRIDSYDQRWALAVLEESLQRCEKHFLSSNREQHWQLFERWVLRPAISNIQPESLEETAGDFGFPSPALAASALQVVKKRILALLREVTAETVDDESEVEGELARIMDYISVKQETVGM